jgi:hypothetical protein
MGQTIKTLAIAVLGVLLGYVGLGGVEPVFINFIALVAATIAVTNFLDELLNIKKFAAVVVSWATGIVLTLVGWLLDLGFLMELLFWQAALTGIGVAVAANFGWDPQMIKKLLEQIGALPGGKKKK